MMAWLLQVALAGSSLQEIHELEWDRAAPAQFVPLLAGASLDERVTVATALGRLRSGEALGPLGELRTDPDEDVRVAAARALAWTPGARELIVTWLGELAPPGGLYGRQHALEGEMVALIEALGHQGQAEDVRTLLELLDEPWPVGGAAARALGRMGNRKVPAIRSVGPALCDRLDATDPRMVADVAWALARIGLESASPDEVAAVQARLQEGTYETTRAWLVRAGWAQLPAAVREVLFLELATDPSRLVRVALFGALRPEDVSADVLGGWVSDPDPWLRLAVVDALGREGSERAQELLARQAERARSEHERAAAIRAGGDISLGESAPAVLRAAKLEQESSPERWLQAALSDEELLVRTAAAGSLMEDPATSWSVGEKLLSAKDPAVREAGIELIKRAPPARRAELLLVHLRVETEPDVLGAGFRALAEVSGELDQKDAREMEAVDAIVRRVTLASEPQVRSGANVMLSALGRAPLPARVTDGTVRQLVLPSGEVVEVEAGRPAVAEVGRIRGARVETSEGTFYIQLDPDTAPLAVWNFATLADAHFYDGLVFHRVVPGFVAQTGCPRGDGWGGPGYTIPDEVSAIPYEAGAVGMARSADRDTGSSQWFVTTSPQPHLVGEYTRFGTVVEGMHVVKRLTLGSQLLKVTIERLPPADGT
jgi:peptidyl-prolyl cis-trans isomerase B (cyclophilin B)